MYLYVLNLVLNMVMGKNNQKINCSAFGLGKALPSALMPHKKFGCLVATVRFKLVGAFYLGYGLDRLMFHCYNQMK